MSLRRWPWQNLQMTVFEMGVGLSLPTLLGLSVLFDSETTELTNLPEYKKLSPSFAYSIEAPIYHSRNQKIY
jgi:hypothetical protein